MGIQVSADRSDVVETGAAIGQISIGTTQTEIKVSTGRLTYRQNILMYNASAVTIWVGPTGVTTTNGFPLFKGEKLLIPIGDEAYYGIVASSTAALNVQELS
jgi:hypothetical protein